MLVRGSSPCPNIQFLDLVLHDVADVEGNGPLDRFVKGFRAYGPMQCQPARGAFHTHAELREPTLVGRRFGGLECPGIVLLGNTGGVVAYDNPTWGCRIQFDINLEPESVAMQGLDGGSVAQKALECVVHELGERIPRLIIEVPKDRENSDTG